jgi:ribulose-phosphate 3-epimerase
MCANALALGEDLRALESAGVDYLHLDIMDGNFVPNIAVGIDLAKQARAATSLPLDAHLMVADPDFWVPRIIDELAPRIVVFHAETTHHGPRLADVIRSRGALAGVALNPGTPLAAVEDLLPMMDVVLAMTVNPGYAGQSLVPGSIEKIARLAELCAERGSDVLIAVDGNVSFEHGPAMRAMGAELFVCGSSSIFRRGIPIAASVAEFRKALEAGSA